MKTKYEKLQFGNHWCPKCGEPMVMKDKTDGWMPKSGGGSIYVAKIVYACQDCDITAEVIWTWTPKKKEIQNETSLQKLLRKKENHSGVPPTHYPEQTKKKVENKKFLELSNCNFKTNFS